MTFAVNKPPTVPQQKANKPSAMMDKRINRQEGRTDRFTSDRNAEKDRDRIHQPVCACVGKPIDDAALAHQVAEHEHTEQRNGIR